MIKQKIINYLFNPNLSYYESDFCESYYDNGMEWIDGDTIDWSSVYEYRINYIINDMSFTEKQCSLSDNRISRAVYKWLRDYVVLNKIEGWKFLKRKLENALKDLED